MVSVPVSDDAGLDEPAAVQFLCGDARAMLATMEPQSVHACICSPPYFGLRHYNGGAQEIGTEQTPREYVASLVEVFQGVWRVLRDDGLLFVVLGDSYASTGGHTAQGANSQRAGRSNVAVQNAVKGSIPAGFKPKELMGIPWRTAFALQDAGWYLRSDIIFSKPNPMPESVRDRPTRAHEYIFMLAKSERYYYDQDAIREPCTMKPQRRLTQRHSAQDAAMRQDRIAFYNIRDVPAVEGNPAGRNMRSVWTIAPAPFSSKKLGMSIEHYAAYPPELIRPMVRAATSEKGVCSVCGAPWLRQVQRQGMVIARSERRDKMGSQGRTQSSGTQVSPAMATTTGWVPTCTCVSGEPVPATVLDPFAGACTSALVARQEGRNAIMVDINPDYLRLGRVRLRHELGLFSGVPAEDGA